MDVPEKEFINPLVTYKSRAIFLIARSPVHPLTTV